MWSTILLLLAGFAIGVAFILLALIVILVFVAIVFDDELKVALASSAPATPLPPWPPAHRGVDAWPGAPSLQVSPSYPRYPGQTPFTTHRERRS